MEDKLTEAGTIIEDLRRLVELKDDELAALQAQGITEQAEPGPDLSERIGAAYDSAVEALSGPMYESVYDRVRDYWLVALACMALLLAGWLLLRRKLARAPKGFSVPAASVRPDFVKVTRDKKTVDSDEDLSDAPEDEEDTVQNKLDLARAYLELGDTENVRAILDEVLSEGNAAQREEARELLEQAKSG